MSARLLTLTLGFTLCVQLLIYVPAISDFRRSWVFDRLRGAQMVALTLMAAKDDALSREIEAQLLAGLKGVQAIGVRGPGTRWLLTVDGQEPPPARREIDLRDPPLLGPLRGIAHNLINPESSLTRILGPGVAGVPGLDWVEVIVDERPFRHALIGYSKRFLLISLAIALAITGLLYWALHMMVVAPVRRLTDNITAFASDPQDARRIISPSGRTDEIGRAEAALARMEGTLATELRRRQRLAELGLAVSKINHELRNMLTTAQLLGDRLGGIADPTVQRTAPRLIATLDRAIAFCGATLAYGRAIEPEPKRARVPLLPIVQEQRDLADGNDIAVGIKVAPDLTIDADPDQLGRVLLNLLRNSV
ncbi:MAG: HAMP domain-containing histidine kinase, partial [Methylobacteriaceae bacterium]|nr:HAMP domain-containing histidine kinase [Methylobacteriaceae bacterium]